MRHLDLNVDGPAARERCDIAGLESGSTSGNVTVTDTGAIEAVIDEILAANPDKVTQYQAGKTGLIGFFVGQCMKATKGQGNPKLINELLAKKLG